MRILVLQHVAFEGPAAIGEWAGQRGHDVHVCRFHNGDSPLEPEQYDFLIVLGGPMSVSDTAAYAWLEDEVSHIARAVGAGKIVLGICLGAQLLARALGARVYRGDRREIGWFPVYLSDAAQDGLFIGYAPRMTAFHWHGDTFDLPAGAVHLARSTAFENQAFSYGDRAVGLQFHLEATGESVAELISHCGQDQTHAVPHVQSAEQMLAADREFGQLHRSLYGLLDRLAARHGQPLELPVVSSGLAQKTDAPPPSVNSDETTSETFPMQRPPHTAGLEQYPKPDPERDAQRQPRQFITFSYYKLDPAWRHLPADVQQRGREEWMAVVREYQASGTVVVPYSCVGVRADHDILLWRIDYKLEQSQQMQAALSRTGLGKYLLPSLSFLSMSKRSVYVDKINPEHEEQRMYIAPGRGKYIFVYPFVKSREWYLLHPQTRQGIMDEHIQVGVKYPSIKLNTTYSFGLDDQDFVVAFEGDYPEDFLDLVMELRETDGSKYTVRNTPIITGVQGTLEEILDTLG